MAGGNRRGPELVPLDMGGHEIKNVQCSLLTPRPNGVADPGSSHEIADAQHSHPASNPVVEGSYLFPCYIPDLYLRAPVRALTEYGGGYGVPGTWASWTKISGSNGTWIWQHNTDGQLHLYSADATVLVPNVGDRVLCLQSNAGVYVPSPYDGIYEILDVGSDTSRAVIRRVADANTSATFCSGMIVQVTGSHAASSPGYWRIATADPIEVDVTTATFEYVASYAEQSILRTLTPAQIVSQGASLDEYGAYTSITSSTPTGLAFFYHPTLPGTPGVAAIPAGLWTVVAKAASATGGDAGATSVLKACFGLVASGWVFADGLPTPFATATSQPLGASPIDVSMQANIAAPVACTPDQRILWWWEAATSSATNVTVAFTWQDAARVTRVATTMQFPVAGGTNWHPDLLGRDQADQHPWSALEPVGQAHQPYATVSIGTGWLDNDGANVLLVVGCSSAGTHFKGLKTPSVASDVTVRQLVAFDGSIVLDDQASSPPGGWSPLRLQASAVSSSNAITLTRAYSVVEFLWLPALSAWLRIGT
jgi:hypothetical protein